MVGSGIAKGIVERCEGKEWGEKNLGRGIGIHGSYPLDFPFTLCSEKVISLTSPKTPISPAQRLKSSSLVHYKSTSIQNVHKGGYPQKRDIHRKCTSQETEYPEKGCSQRGNSKTSHETTDKSKEIEGDPTQWRSLTYSAAVACGSVVPEFLRSAIDSEREVREGVCGEVFL